MKTINPTIKISGAVCGLLLAGYGVQAQTLFVGSYGSESIVEFSGTTPSTFANGLDYPTGLAFDSSGDLFESDQSSGNIYEWAAGGTARTTFAKGLAQPNFLAFNSSGDLFIDLSGASVEEFNSAGTVINTITGLKTSSGMAFDSAGNLYIANANGEGAGAGYITKITTGGMQSTFASGLSDPWGMAFNAAGDLFVADDSVGTITEITPGGSKSSFATGLNAPTDIAFDNAGDLFVTDSGVNSENGDITEFAAGGGSSLSITSVSKPMSLAFEGVTLPVPEPSEYALFGLGLLALVLNRKKKQTAQSLGCQK